MLSASCRARTMLPTRSSTRKRARVTTSGGSRSSRMSAVKRGEFGGDAAHGRFPRDWPITVAQTGRGSKMDEDFTGRRLSADSAGVAMIVPCCLPALRCCPAARCWLPPARPRFPPCPLSPPSLFRASSRACAPRRVAPASPSSPSIARSPACGPTRKVLELDRHQPEFTLTWDAVSRDPSVPTSGSPTAATTSPAQPTLLADRPGPLRRRSRRDRRHLGARIEFRQQDRRLRRGGGTGDARLGRPARQLLPRAS